MAERGQIRLQAKDNKADYDKLERASLISSTKKTFWCLPRFWTAHSDGTIEFQSKLPLPPSLPIVKTSSAL